MAPLPDRWTVSGLTWKPRLAEWQSGGTIVAGDQRSGLRLAIGAVRGVPILVTENGLSVRLWDPATGQPIGEPLPAPNVIRALALAEGPALVLAACEGGHVIAWDALTHLPSATVEISDPTPSALAVGDIEDRWVVAAGGASGVVQVRWVDSGDLIHEFRDDEPVRAVALAKAGNGRLHLAIGYGGVDHGRIAVYDAVSGEPCYNGIRVAGEVTNAALALMDGKLLVAAGTTTGSVGVWDALSGAPVWPPVSLDGEVSSVALATVGGVQLLATGSRDRTARLWHVAAGGSAGPPLRHPAPVESLAFGEVDGRTMLVTGCLDGNTRLWDPMRASAARVAVEGWFPSVAVDASVVVAESDNGHVRALRLYDLRTGELTIPPVEMSSTANGIAWGRVGDRDVVITAHFATVRVWNPRTGRKITELPFGTRIGAMSVQQTDGGRLLVAVSGPGLVLTDLREISWPPEQQTNEAPTGPEQGISARSVPKPVFTDAEAGAKTFPDSTKREFNYYTPAKRKQTRYEDVTVEVQPDPRHYLSQGWLYGFSDGRGGYPLDWTALKAWGSDRPEPERYPGSGGKGYDWPAHGWHEFRDPNEEWELTLYRYNANVVRQLNQNIDVARQTKAFDQWGRDWIGFVESQRRRLDARRPRARPVPVRQRQPARAHQHAQQRDLGEQHAPDPFGAGPGAVQPDPERSSLSENLSPASNRDDIKNEVTA